MWAISSAFRAALRSPVHTMAIKAQVLDTDFNVVEGGEFYDTGAENTIQNYIVDGSVDADVSRGTRRTMTLSLLNPDAEFTPRSDWGGLFYVDRLIRIYRGVRLPTGTEEYVPIGTFMIDTADVVAERNMSIVAMSGSDQWKKLSKAKLGLPLKYDSGTGIQAVILDLIDRAGVTRYMLDDLSERTSSTKVLQADLNYEAETVIGDTILSLATAWGLDCYFDPMGRFISEDAKLNRPTVWEYKPDEVTDLLTVKASYKDEQLYNHIRVVGTADENNPIVQNAFDLNPLSPTNIDRIGRRTFTYESKYIATSAQALDVANKLLAKHTTVTEDIEAQVICNPAFEGNDVIVIREPTFTKLNHRLRLQAFSIPLSSSRQSLRLKRLIVV